MKLSDDCRLTYVITHEAWYGQIPTVISGPQINVVASAEGGGCEWEFLIEERDLGRSGKPIRLGVFDDAFAAFEQIPEFFTALGEQKPSTLAEVVKILDGIGAVDVTERTRRS